MTGQNYFLEHPRYLDNPHGWIQHIPFAFFLVETLQPALITELGTYSGNSYFAFCQAVKDMKIPSNCYAIDTWEGDIHVGNYKNDVFERVSRINEKEFSHFSTLKRMTFDQALPDFRDNSIDLLHIDGTHTYGAVKHDFESWLPKMSEEGIILLHDTRVRKRDFGVWKFYEEIKNLFPSFEFHYSEGLAVVCTGKNFHPSLQPLIVKKPENAWLLKLLETLGENIRIKREMELLRQDRSKFRKKSAKLNTELLESKKLIKKMRKQQRLNR